MGISDLEKTVKVMANNIRFPSRIPEFELVHSAHIDVGDIAIFQVDSDHGGYIEQLNLKGNPVRLRKGESMIGVFGIRHSGTNISGDIPLEGLTVNADDNFQILSSAGIVGKARRIPSTIGVQAVELYVKGIISCGGKAVNLLDITPYKPSKSYDGDTPIVLSLGSSAECGKTTIVSKLINHFVTEYGMRVAACKTNGTGNIRDKYSMRDAGAQFYLDYVDFGLATTYAVDAKKYIPILKGLLSEAEKIKPDVIILECGGDVMWANVPDVLKDPQISKNVVAATMCSTDYMAAYGAYVFVRQCGVTFPIYFNVPVGKETFYRRGFFERMVDSQVFDIMVPAERSLLAGKINELVRVK